GLIHLIVPVVTPPQPAADDAGETRSLRMLAGLERLLAAVRLIIRNQIASAESCREVRAKTRYADGNIRQIRRDHGSGLLGRLAVELQSFRYAEFHQLIGLGCVAILPAGEVEEPAVDHVAGTIERDPVGPGFGKLLRFHFADYVQQVGLVLR